MNRLDFIELLLFLVAISSGIGSVVFGIGVQWRDIQGRIISGPGLNSIDAVESVASSLETGLNGGAIGLSIISASSIIMITWIELTRLKLRDIK